MKGVVTGMNTVVKSLNNLKIDPPEWVTKLTGVKSFGFDLKTITAPKIPKLATGTVVPANYGNFLVTLGDNKREPEVVSPLSTMKQALKEAMAELGETDVEEKFAEILKEAEEIKNRLGEMVEEGEGKAKTTNTGGIVQKTEKAKGGG
jgi:hypothetical protein